MSVEGPWPIMQNWRDLFAYSGESETAAFTVVMRKLFGTEGELEEHFSSLEPSNYEAEVAWGIEFVSAGGDSAMFPYPVRKHRPRTVFVVWLCIGLESALLRGLST